jgi:hypothetical protein
VFGRRHVQAASSAIDLSCGYDVGMDFYSESDRDGFGGMTVNERLFTAGLLEAFDDAARRRDRERLVDLLVQVELSRTDAESSVATLLADPAKYGY